MEKSNPLLKGNLPTTVFRMLWWLNFGFCLDLFVLSRMLWLYWGVVVVARWRFNFVSLRRLFLCLSLVEWTLRTIPPWPQHSPDQCIRTWPWRKIFVLVRCMHDLGIIKSGKCDKSRIQWHANNWLDLGTLVVQTFRNCNNLGTSTLGCNENCR